MMAGEHGAEVQAYLDKHRITKLFEVKEGTFILEECTEQQISTKSGPVLLFCDFSAGLAVESCEGATCEPS